MHQVCGVSFGQSADVYAEGGLHHHADDCAQIGMADEEVVQVSSVSSCKGLSLPSVL